MRILTRRAANGDRGSIGICTCRRRGLFVGVQVRRNADVDAQAAGVAELDGGLMHLAHRRDEAEAETGSFLAAVLVEPVEALEDVFLLARGDAGPAVADLQMQHVAADRQRDRDAAAGRRVLVGVVEQVADGLQPQVAVAVGRRAVRRRLDVETDVLVGEDHIVDLAHLLEHAVEVEVDERLPARALFELRDAQQRVERGEHLVGLGDDRVDGVVAALGDAEQQFELAPQARQRRLQVVRDGVGHFAHALHQLVDLVEHVIDDGGDVVEVVVAAGDLDALLEVAAGDALAGLVDDAQSPHLAQRDEQRDEQRQRGGQQQAPHAQLVQLLDGEQVAVERHAVDQRAAVGQDALGDEAARARIGAGLLPAMAGERGGVERAIAEFGFVGAIDVGELQFAVAVEQRHAVLQPGDLDGQLAVQPARDAGVLRQLLRPLRKAFLDARLDAAADVADQRAQREIVQPQHQQAVHEPHAEAGDQRDAQRRAAPPVPEFRCGQPAAGQRADAIRIRGGHSRSL